MNFVDGFVNTVGTFFNRKVSLAVNGCMYELSIQQWGALEVAKLNTESVQHLVDVVNNEDYQRNGVDLQIQQEHGIQTLTIPAWAIRQLQHDLVHGNIQLPYIDC